MSKDTGKGAGKGASKDAGKDKSGDAAELDKGDSVAWKTAQGETHGTVVRKVTGTAHVKGHVAKASRDEPQYEVESDKTGAHAIHKPDALKKV